MKLGLSCREVSRLLSAGQDQLLPAHERARLRLHFVMCEACRNVEAQFDLIRRAMRTLGDGDPPAPRPGARPPQPPSGDDST